MISILTPTYNRGYLLERLYRSLSRQTSKKFEWVVIDDGSEDNTQEIITQWADAEKEFKIKYYKTSNGGKHRAINLGVERVKFEYTFIVDSDDYLVDKAIEYIEEWLKTIKDNKDFAGVAGLKAYNQKEVVGQYPTQSQYNEYIDSTNLERKKNKLLGDKAEIYKTELLKKYKFPEYENEKFLTEAAIWNQIAYEGLKVRWFNKIIYICEYCEDGLTKMGIEKELNNFKGFTYFIRIRIKTEKKFNIAPICSFCNIAKKKGITKKEMAEILEVNNITIYTAYYLDAVLRKARKILIDKGQGK